MAMTKTQLQTIVHATACGAQGGLVPDQDFDDGWYGLVNEMGLETFARYIDSLRHRFTVNNNDWMFSVGSIDKFDTIPSAVEHIWDHRHNLKPWKKDD